MGQPSTDFQTAYSPNLQIMTRIVILGTRAHVLHVENVQRSSGY